MQHTRITRPPPSPKVSALCGFFRRLRAYDGAAGTRPRGRTPARQRSAAEERSRRLERLAGGVGPAPIWSSLAPRYPAQSTGRPAPR